MDSLRDKRALVTGAAGFVGANLIKQLLRHGAQVHAVVRPTTRLWRIEDDLPALVLHVSDLTDHHRLQSAVDAARPDVVFHLAAPGGHPATPQARVEFLASAVLGTAHLLEALAPLDYQRLVVAGSSLEYGPRLVPHTESDRLEPTTARGTAKAAASLLCLQRARAERRPIVVLRLFSVYGCWENPSRLIPTVIRSVLRGADVLLTAPGVRHDFVFVEDVVDAMLLAAARRGADGEVINIGSGQQWSNEDIVDQVQQLTGRTVPVRAGEYPAQPADTGYWVADIRKAAAVLGWRPRHDLARGLQKTIEWFRVHQDAHDRVTAARG